MKVISVLSLSGGQGKTTITTLLARLLSREHIPTLVVDGDPQHNLTTFLGIDIVENEPTLLEVIKNTVEIDDAIYPIQSEENLFIIPSDDGLDLAQDFLSTSGVGALLLKQRLQAVKDDFTVCLIDSPPQRSQLSKTIIGASDLAILPCESTVKGFGSLTRTVSAIAELRELNASSAEILGIIPFRDRWIGSNQSTESRLCVEAMKSEMGEELLLPSVLESERYKQAISKGKTLSELGFADLGYPLDVLVEKIKELV